MIGQRIRPYPTSIGGRGRQVRLVFVLDRRSGFPKGHVTFELPKLFRPFGNTQAPAAESNQALGSARIEIYRKMW